MIPTSRVDLLSSLLHRRFPNVDQRVPTPAIPSVHRLAAEVVCAAVWNEVDMGPRCVMVAVA